MSFTVRAVTITNGNVTKEQEYNRGTSPRNFSINYVREEVNSYTTDFVQGHNVHLNMTLEFDTAPIPGHDSTPEEDENPYGEAPE